MVPFIDKGATILTSNSFLTSGIKESKIDRLVNVSGNFIFLRKKTYTNKIALIWAIPIFD